jgi:hypothetical protein
MLLELVSHCYAYPTYLNLADAYTEIQFCNQFASSTSGYCFDGQPYQASNAPPTVLNGTGICVRNVINSIPDMITFGAPNDGSNRIFISTRVRYCSINTSFLTS